jgi:hypothetical protein
MQRNSGRIAASGASFTRIPAGTWIRGAAGTAVLTALIAVAQPPQQSNPDKPYLVPEVNRLPDKNDQMQMNSDHVKKQKFDAANAERQRQIADDTARLLELATQLKAEVDKTSKDTLSLNVIRKAETIEKLAKGVKDKMKLTMGAS